MMDISVDNPYFKQDPVMFRALAKLVSENGRSYSRKLSSKGTGHDPRHSECFCGLLDWVVECTAHKLGDRHDIKTRVAWILLGITDFPACACCGASENYFDKNITVSRPYGEYCCVKCSSTSVKAH